MVDIPLSEEQLMWLQSDHVIANPRRRAEHVGFQFIRRGGDPVIAFRMDEFDLGIMIGRLRRYATDASAKYQEILRGVA